MSLTTVVAGQSYTITELLGTFTPTDPNIIGVGLEIIANPSKFTVVDGREILANPPYYFFNLYSTGAATSYFNNYLPNDPSTEIQIKATDSGSLTLTGYYGQWPADWFAGPNFPQLFYSWSISFTVQQQSALFTSGVDTVNFDDLNSSQQAAINDGADLYDALGGGDNITLPNANPTDTSVALAGTSKTFDLTNAFILGDNTGDTTSITGGNGSYRIQAGDGNDTISVGNGNNIITVGAHGAKVTIGSGSNQIVSNAATSTAIALTDATTVGFSPVNSFSSATFTHSTPTDVFAGGIYKNQNLALGGVLFTNQGGNTVFASAGSQLDTLKNVQFVQAGSAGSLSPGSPALPLDAIKVVFNENGNGYGTLSVTDNGKPIAGLASGVSCAFDQLMPIPNGTYDLIYRINAGNGAALELSDYNAQSWFGSARQNIQIHIGNNPGDSIGCIVVGNNGNGAGGANTDFWNVLTGFLSQITSKMSPTTSLNGELFYQLPIPITLQVEDAPAQPILHIQKPTVRGNQATVEFKIDGPDVGMGPIIDKDITFYFSISGVSPSAYTVSNANLLGNNVYEATIVGNHQHSTVGGSNHVDVSITYTGPGVAPDLRVQLVSPSGAKISDITQYYDGQRYPTIPSPGKDTGYAPPSQPLIDATSLVPQIIKFSSSKVAKGYISGATVFADANGNGQLDPGEASTTTDATGSFSLSDGSYPLIAFGGTDVSTDLPFKGMLLAPAGSTDITPLTTLLKALGSDPSAQQKILSGLGLSSSLDLITFDPIAAAQGGSADGAATEVAGAKVYDTVEMIGSALVGAGGQFMPSLQAAFSALASTLDGAGFNLSDQTALSALITQVAQAKNITLGAGVADSVAAVIAAGNAALDHLLQTDQPGSTLLNDTAAVELVMQGPASAAIQQAANDPARLQNVIATFTGTSLDTLISAALNQLGPDTGAGEQAALKLTINNGAATPLGVAIVGNVPFMIAGLRLKDSGTVQFTDGNGKTVQVDVNGGQTSYTVNLGSLADGTITSSLSVNPDPAGNSFTPVAGNAVSLDTNAAFAPVLQVDGGAANVFVNATIAKAVPVTLTGLESGDTGTVTFTDSTGHTVPLSVSANQTSYAVDLSSLADGAITSSLLVTDAASNTATAAGNPVILDQDKVAEVPILTIAKTSLTIPAGGSIPLGIKVTLVDGDDDSVLVTISDVPQGFESITADDGHAPVSHHGANYTFTAADVNAGLTLHSTYRGGGHPVNKLTVTASNTTAGETAEATPVSIVVTDRPTSLPACASSGSKSLGDLITQFGSGHDFHHSASNAMFERLGDDIRAKVHDTIPNISALIERFIGGHPESRGAPGLLGNSLVAEEQKALLAIHHG